MNDPKLKILSIEDDFGVHESLSLALSDMGDLVFFTNAEDALKHLEKDSPVDVIFVDVILPGISGLEALPKIKKLRPHLPVIFITAVEDAMSGAHAIKTGAYDYFVKPFVMDDLRNRLQHLIHAKKLEKENRRLRNAVKEKGQHESLIGISRSMNEVREKVHTAAASRTAVLITGETGTGKDLAARLIHTISPFSSRPFIAINCAALPRDLAESELFGHEKGAFTGAGSKHAGAFEQAMHGTLFLDEIGELDPKIQAKLLRVLEDMKVTRIGGRTPIHVNIRIICATNRDLKSAVSAKTFRQDLFYRICVFNINIPPLRERPEDIKPILYYWAERLQLTLDLPELPQFSDDFTHALSLHSWPGNVRELKNFLESLLLNHRNLSPLFLEAKHLPSDFKEFRHKAENLIPYLQKGTSIQDQLQFHEAKVILEAYQHALGKTKRVSEMLNISPRLLQYRIRRLGIRKAIDQIRKSPE